MTELLVNYFESLQSIQISTKCVFVIMTVITVIWLLRIIFKKHKNDKILKKKRREVDDKKLSLFQKLEGLRYPFENIKQHCQLSGMELLKKVKSEELAPIDILEAYQANALVKSNEFNFIADVIYDADVSALLINKNEQKELLAWPLSVSDSFFIEKYDCTQGLKSRILKPSSKTSAAIQVLKDEGAIPFIITNVSQGLQKMESNNPVFGKTLNPFNKKMTSGGSSGGEGAALGTGSSLIGIGNDLCGGIRIPAYYCGVYGLKPTSTRISSRNTDKYFFCNLIIKLSIGPMARNIDDLIAIFKALTSNRIFEIDAYSPPVYFKESMLLSKSRLKIGYYTFIGGNQVRPVPAVERAVMIAKKALEKAGHEMVVFNFPKIDAVFSLISKLLNVDGGKKLLKEGLMDGPIDQSLLFNSRISRTPRFIRYFISYLGGLFNLSISQRIAESMDLSIFEILKLNEQVTEYREEILSKFEKEKIDGIICPVLPIVAPPTNTCNQLKNIDIYCTIYNLLDYPAGTIPISTVSKEDIEQLNTLYPKLSNMEKMIIRLQNDSIGLPVGVQCVTMPWREETCLKIMKDIVSNR